MFGKIAVGQSPTKNLIVSNTGKTHSLIISSAISSDPEYATSGTGTCGHLPITVAPKTKCTLGVAFAPSNIGTHNATLTLTDNATTSPQHVALSGTGISGLSTTSSELNFDGLTFGTKSQKSFYVTNHQTRSVTLSDGFSGINPTDFSRSGGSCTSTLAASATCHIAVSFTPSVMGTESATLSLFDSPDPLSPHAIALTAGSPIPETIAPLKRSYGTVSRTSSKTLQIIVTNKSPITISIGSYISGANARDFTITDGACGPSLSGNASCVIGVKFKPAKTTSERATLTISVPQDPTSPRAVTLTGTGS